MPIAGQTEILVNSNLTGNQQFSSMTTLLDGSIVVCWTDYSGTGADQTGSSIHSQRFTAAGIPIGSETQVNIVSDGGQNASSVTALVDGGYVVVWQTVTEEVGYSYSLRTFDADGIPTSGEIAIPGVDGYQGTRPYAAQLSNGDILVSFTANGTSPSFADTVIAHVSDYASTPTVTAQIVTQSFPTSVQANNSVTALANGGYVVATQSVSNSGYSIQYNIFDNAGSQVASSATPLDSTPTLNTFSDMRPIVSALSDGNFVVVWSSNGGGGDGQGSGIKASVINGTTGAVIDTIVVNQETTGEQTMPSVVVTDTGDIIVAWTDRNGSGGDNSVAAIKGQVLAWDGTDVTANGGEFLVNQSVDGEQRVSALTSVAGGGFAVSWTDYGAGSNLGASGIGVTGTGDIKMRIYTNSAVNDAPEISTSGGNQTGTITVAYGQTSVFDFNATDNNPGDTQFWSIIGSDAHLFSIDSATGVLSFIDPAQVGTFDVTVLVEDSGLLEDSQDITVNVLNTPPDAVNDNYNAFAGQTLIISTLFDNDIDAADGQLTYANFDAITAPTQNGTLVDNHDGTFSYTANPGFTGEDSFSYRVVDANGEPDIATVSIHVETPPENVLDFSATGLVADFDGDPSTPDTHAVSVRVNLLDYSSQNGGYVESYVPSTGGFVAFYVSDLNNSPSTIGRVIGTANNDQFANSSPNPARTVIFEGGNGDDTYNANAGFGGNSFDGGSGSNQYILVADLGVPVNVTVDFGIVDANGFATVNLDSGALGSTSDKVKSVQHISTSYRGGDDSIDASTLSSNFFAVVGGGTDIVVTGSGDDEVVVGMGVKTLDGGAGNDWVNFSPYTFYGSGLTGGLSINLDNGTSYYSNAPAAPLQDQSILLNFENAYGSILDDTIVGTAGDNRLDGYDGNDVLTGGLGIDDLRGGLGNDRLTGGAGGDFLYGGNDFVVGNEMDTAVYAGAFSEYTIQADPFSPTRTLVSEITSGETDGLFAIEKLEFDDGTYDVLTGVFTSNLNTPPVLAGDLTASIDEDGGYAFTLADLSFTDSEDNASEVTFTTSSLVNGFILVRGVDANSFTAQDIADGVVKFIHDGSETLTAGFSVTVEDGNEDNSQPPAPVPFTFTVNPQNDAPSASFSASGFQAIEQEGVTLSNGTIIISDADAGSGIMGVSLQVGEGDLSINVGTNAVTVFPPATPGGLFGLNGTLAAINAVLAGLNGASISYANNSDTPSTSTSLQIGINDFGNSGAGGAQGVFVNVPIAITAVNDGPVANADLNVVVEEDASILVDVLANDSDAEGDALTLTGIGIAPALAGQISVAIENNQIRVIPAPNVNGSFAFNYTVSDGQGGSSTANVNVFVQSVNDAPIAADDQTFTGDEDTAINGNLLASDVDFNTLSFTVVTGPSHGTLNLAANGQFTFDPTTNFNGHDSFTYQVDDGFGGIITRNAKLDVSAVNDIAVASDDLNVVMQEDASILVDVLANDSDADGDALTITGIGIAPALAGQIFVAIENNQIRVTPAPNINGSFSFNYTVSDGHGGTSTANVSVDVQNVNDAPVVAASLIDRSSPEDAPFNFTLPADSFGDVDFDPLSLSATLGDGTALPAWLAFNAATRSFSGTPPLNFNGFLDVRVTASDGTLAASDVFRLTITPVNDAPTDIQLSGTSIAENSANGTAIGTLSFSDPDFGDSVVYSLVAGVGAADNGLVSIVGNQVRVNGAIDFEANPTLDLRVRATDSGGLFIEKSITVAVTDVVEGPVLNVINGVAGQFSVAGTNGNDQIFVGPSNFLVNANAGNDIITLTPSANNFIHYFNGGAGNDTLDLSLMTNGVSVDLGSGVSQGQQVGLLITNSIENAIGGSGNDTLVGNTGANQLNGGLGNDSISGEGGSDVLIGGGGSDTFIFDDNDSGVGLGNRDQILDFIQGIDRLDIRQIDANVARGSDQAFLASISFWNGVGNEFAANSAGTIKYHYETILGVQHTIIDLNNDADRAADIQIALVGTYTFNNTSDFLL